MTEGKSHPKRAKYEKKKIMDAPPPVDSAAAVDAWTISRARSAYDTLPLYAIMQTDHPHFTVSRTIFRA